MKQEKYEFKSSDSLLEFRFFSEGPKGEILKVVRYEETFKEPSVYNLAFGDDLGNGDVSDEVVTDNGDTEKVLATVGQTILDFFKIHPSSWIIVKGRTESRSRLYRIKVAQNLDDIRQQLKLFGHVNEEWRPFEKNVNYDSFLIGLKD